MSKAVQVNYNDPGENFKIADINSLVVDQLLLFVPFY
jgi:hypothetical protein